MTTSRKLKVQETADRYKLRQGNATSTPQITLKGKWLGTVFSAGDTVVVELDERHGGSFPMLRIRKEYHNE